MIYYSWGQVSNDATICESPILFKSVLLSVGFWCCSWLMCWGMNLHPNMRHHNVGCFRLCSVLQQLPLPSTDCRYGKKTQPLKTHYVGPTSQIKPLKASDVRCGIDSNFNELWYPIWGKQNFIQQKKTPTCFAWRLNSASSTGVGGSGGPVHVQQRRGWNVLEKWNNSKKFGLQHLDCLWKLKSTLRFLLGWHLKKKGLANPRLFDICLGLNVFLQVCGWKKKQVHKTNCSRTTTQLCQKQSLCTSFM